MSEAWVKGGPEGVRVVLRGWRWEVSGLCGV